MSWVSRVFGPMSADSLARSCFRNIKNLKGNIIITLTLNLRFIARFILCFFKFHYEECGVKYFLIGEFELFSGSRTYVSVVIKNT